MTAILKFEKTKKPYHGYHPPLLDNEAGCTGCDLCGLYCPDFAIFGVREPVEPEKTVGTPEVASPAAGS